MINDKNIQTFIGQLLRWCVIISLGVAFVGGIIYLSRHGQDTLGDKYKHFTEQNNSTVSILHQTYQNILAGKGRDLILLGILLLIAAPVLRVLCSLLGFVLEKDKLYIIITLIVLGVIATSIVGGLG
ncbi:MAG: DUF1634 domain-containing protein [Chitinophagaceae bacterium]|jgi:uncharacterized membrane protein|nr:DUF1634 domain-containing protein [Chitinophagaceae bacterium]